MANILLGGRAQLLVLPVLGNSSNMEIYTLVIISLRSILK